MREIAYFEKITYHLKRIASFVGIVAFVEIVLRVKISELSFIENCGVLGVIGVLVIGSILFIRSSLEKKSSWGSFVIFGNCLSFVAYLFLRCMFSEDVNQYISHVFNLDLSNMLLFRSLFSWGYVGFQLFVGYFVSKFGSKFLGIFNIANGFLTVGLVLCGLTTQNDFIFYSVFALRTLAGISCASTVMSVAYNLKKFNVIQSRFGTLFNFIALFGFIFSLWTFRQFSGPITSVSFSLMMSIVAVLFIISGVIFVIDSFVTRDQSDKSSLPYLNIIRYLVTNKRYMILFIQSILILAACAPLRDVFQSEISNGVIDAPEMFKGFFEKFSVFNMVFLVSFLSSIGFLRSILMFSVLSSIGVGILLFHIFVFQLPIIVVAGGFALLGFSSPSHAIVQSFVGEIEKDPEVSSTLVAVLNTGTMCLGATLLAQNIIPMLGLINSNGGVYNLTYAMLFIGICCALSLLLSIYAYFSFNEKE